jgi:hypothetical protein
MAGNLRLVAYRRAQVNEWQEYAKVKPTKEDFEPYGQIQVIYGRSHTSNFTKAQYGQKTLWQFTHWRRITPPKPLKSESVKVESMTSSPSPTTRHGEQAIGSSVGEQEAVAREAADEIFKMFAGILHRINERIDSGLLEGIGEEARSVKFEDVLDLIRSAIDKSRAGEIASLKCELSYMKLQRDALLDITWLDLPGEPSESTRLWREQFNKGWMRRLEVIESRAAQSPRIKCDHCSKEATRRSQTFLFCEEHAPKTSEVIEPRAAQPQEWDDTQRLDWLNRKDCKISFWNITETFEVQSEVIGYGKTIREAIDAAHNASLE